MTISPYRTAGPTFSPSFVPRSSSHPIVHGAATLPPRPIGLPPRPTSSSYVPRSASLPRPQGRNGVASPRLNGPSEVRLTSGLRNEVRNEASKAKDEKEGDEIKDEVMKILKQLPPPLPPSLPKKYLETPPVSPPAQKPSFTNFLEYSQSKLPIPPQSTTAANSKKRPASLAGLGLELTEPERKKRTTVISPGLRTPAAVALSKSASTGTMNGRSSTPLDTIGTTTPQLGRSVTTNGSRHEMNGHRDEKERWKMLAAEFFQRATHIKRMGTTLRSSETSSDRLKGILFQTEAVLLYVYSFWCTEQRGTFSGHIETAPLREIVKVAWEKEARDNREGDIAEVAEGMLGLLHTIDHIYKTKMLASSASLFENYLPDPLAATINPSPASTSDSPPTNTGPSPSSSSDTHRSNPSRAGLQRLLQRVVSLGNSFESDNYDEQMEYFTLPFINQIFPQTFEKIVHANRQADFTEMDIDDDSIPVAWPGIYTRNQMAEVVVVGRTMINEVAEMNGWEWHKNMGTV
ncbi:hypothetical protein TREMEDRAFT_58191 [Tremella mesenterica DSM 1558]|uniref:uncharacterized protein n=1 Tax=Tremella mesenterica (strain ATCC 24925 / CBS 8224 / DSM 1558 / NBRC 9311 / NRRL Y-6157 / RJB 2259-6 / UBC 559-6) TaxID=578456 RepID=UPI0003F4922C|nr:uncharacterized protein TREMEDRAFT_58191 [Tremella mesenterica DSM 1558]EIW72042.1 hypothetical protein TREMEDRAFT_58191 [Tremella mesenterica DSM 1558]